MAEAEGSRAEAFLVLVGGPSGSGKTALVDMLVQRHPGTYARAPSYTTRKRRDNESGKEYIFVSEGDLLSLDQRGELLNLDHVYGHSYGMSRSAVEGLLAGGLTVLKEVHPANHPAIRRTVERVLTVLLLPEHTPEQPLDDERCQRRWEDGAFYPDLEVEQFDIVRRISRGDGLSDVCAGLHTTIQAVASGAKLFPRAQDIDRVNRTGYSHVAREFRDDARVTTAAFHDLSRQFFAEAIQRYVTPASRCLEIGPGSGWLRASIAWPAAEYLGVDLCGEMVREVLKDSQEEAIKVANARALPFASSSFNAVLGSLCDPYCYPAALCEIARVLAPGGTFIATLPSAKWASAVRAPDAVDRTTFQLADGTSAEVFSFTFEAEALSQLLRSCGLEIVTCEELAAGALGAGAAEVPMFQAAAKHLEISVQDLLVLVAAIAQKPGNRER